LGLMWLGVAIGFYWSWWSRWRRRRRRRRRRTKFAQKGAIELIGDRSQLISFYEVPLFQFFLEETVTICTRIQSDDGFRGEEVG